MSRQASARRVARPVRLSADVRPDFYGPLGYRRQTASAGSATPTRSILAVSILVSAAAIPCNHSERLAQNDPSVIIVQCGASTRRPGSGMQPFASSLVALHSFMTLNRLSLTFPGLSK